MAAVNSVVEVDTSTAPALRAIRSKSRGRECVQVDDRLKRCCARGLVELGLRPGADYQPGSLVTFVTARHVNVDNGRA